MKWRSMKTAPKDQKILLFVPDDDDGEIFKIGQWTNLPARPGWFFRGGWLAEDVPSHWSELEVPRNASDETQK